MVWLWTSALSAYWSGYAILHTLFLCHLPDAVIAAIVRFARDFFPAVFAWLGFFESSPYVRRMLLFVLLLGFAGVIAVGAVAVVGEEHLVAPAAVHPVKCGHQRPRS